MKMPYLATTTDTVTVLSWLVEVDGPIKRGEPLLEIETDKSIMEVESYTTGTLCEIHVQPGDEVVVGELIATIEVEG